MRGTNEEYWSDYDGLQKAKHSILKNYLNAWFPILTSWSGEVIYIDCNAGRGRHETGEPGSPIIAINCLLNHSLRDRILANAKVNLLFFESDECNASVLQDEISKLGNLPDRINCDLVCDDYQKQLSERLNLLEKTGGKLAPAFAFVDPFGFRISMDLLNRLLSFSKCELFINLMYRYIDMSMRNPAHTGNIDNLFGGTVWYDLRDIQNPEERLSKTVKLFADQLHAAYVTRMIMRGERNQVKYVLIHAAHHPKAREVMKEAIWKVIPDGSFTAYERDNPEQLVLIEPEPDLSLLENILWNKFRSRKVRMEEIYYTVSNTLYLQKHVHSILKEYLKRNIITASEFDGRFAFSKNPLIHFPDEPQYLYGGLFRGLI